MLTKKYNNIQHEVTSLFQSHKGKKIEEAEFDGFVDHILTNDTLDLHDRVYCRDGFAWVNEIDYNTFQILAFQINTFAKGAFADTIKKLCTPILLTVKTHGSHRQAEHSLADTSISIEDFYLGKNYSGSLGEKCDRQKISDHARAIYIAGPVEYSYNHQIIYQLINTNYICHHVAETMSYAFGALDLYWATKQNHSFMVSASHFYNNKHKLVVEIIENFSSERMRNYFDIPHYAMLIEDISKFKEDYGLMLWEVDFKKDVESFYLPVGFQRIGSKRFKKSVNIITTQHILDHVLNSYYRRKNPHIVSNTYQTLEFLSRAIIAKLEGKDDEGRNFLKSASSCMGHYPERDFTVVLQKMKERFHIFQSEFAHTNFFRPPVL